MQSLRGPKSADMFSGASLRAVKEERGGGGGNEESFELGQCRQEC